MSNLLLLNIPIKEKTRKHEKKINFEAEKERAEWLERQMRKFYSYEEVDQVLTNRRSEYSDERLIEDFKECEQPIHIIPKNYDFYLAVESVKEHFAPMRKLRPVAFPDLRYYPWSLAISAEMPWTGENFKFVPFFRDLDSETTKPRLGGDPDRAEKWRKFKEYYDKGPFRGQAIHVQKYLAMKQRFGLIKDSKTTFHNLYDEMFQYNRGRVHIIKDRGLPFFKTGKPRPYYWHTLHARSHVVAKDEPDKIRAVFGVTKLLLMVELMFIWPLQASYLNGGSGRMLWGYEMSRGGWKKLYNEMHMKGPPNTVLGVDWSKFDKRLLHELIDVVHDIWRSYFDFDQYEPNSIWPKTNVKEERLENLWEWMTGAIKSTPILLPNNEVWAWTRNGFASGFQQTQLMDTFANAVMVYTCLSSLGVKINAETFWSKFQGDDSLLKFVENMFQLYGNNFLDMLAKSAMFYFNAKLNVKKSEIQDKVTGMSVLSYSNKFGICSRTEEDLLRHLFFPERDRDYAKLAATAVGLAIASGGEYDRFHKLCEKIFTHITHRWGLTPKWKVLQWMVRAHLYGSMEDLVRLEFPTQLSLQASIYQYKERSESEKQRQWPTYAKEKGDFYFLEPVQPNPV